jgi:hypothetical protein
VLRSLFLLAAVTLAGATLHAKPSHAKKPSLEPFAGSYTGTATSATAAGALSGPATLTFTGRPRSLRGTFLYTGILNAGGVAQNVVQTLEISKAGLLRGRVSLNEVTGEGSGKVRLNGKVLRTDVTYTIATEPATVVRIVGRITFTGKRAKWMATVSSADPNFAGSLLVKGKR